MFSKQRGIFQPPNFVLLLLKLHWNFWLKKLSDPMFFNVEICLLASYSLSVLLFTRNHWINLLSKKLFWVKILRSRIFNVESHLLVIFCLFNPICFLWNNWLLSKLLFWSIHAFVRNFLKPKSLV
jgi:hypothetical protein